MSSQKEDNTPTEAEEMTDFSFKAFAAVSLLVGGISMCSIHGRAHAAEEELMPHQVVQANIVNAIAKTLTGDELVDVHPCKNVPPQNRPLCIAIMEETEGRWPDCIGSEKKDLPMCRG